MVELKQLIKSKELAKFKEYSKGNFWYILDSGFEFPIPLSDIGDGALPSIERASLLFRWINIHQNHKPE